MDSGVGQKISLLQAEQNVSNIELARKLGVKPQNIPALRKVKKHRLTTIHRLARAFNVPVTFFL